MAWKLVKSATGSTPIWERQIDGVTLTIERSDTGNYPWRWCVQYGMTTVFGYSKTIRAAKMQSTRRARQYVLQGNLWGF